MMKAIVAWWGKNPVAGNLLMILSVVFGLISFFMMDREFQPGIKDQGVEIAATWIGASPQDVERQVVTRIEEAVSSIDGIRRIRSQANEGYGWVYLAADPSKDVNVLLDEVQTQVDSISGLPRDLEPLRVRQSVYRDWAVMVALHGNVSERTLYDLAERVRGEIAALPGGALAIISDRRPREISIEVSQEALRRYAVTFDEVARAVRATSIDLSSGVVRTAAGDYQLRARNLGETGTDFETIVVRQTADGSTVRVGDLAKVVDGFADYNLESRQDGQPATMIVIQAADRFNLSKTSEAVRTYMETLNASGRLPEGVRLSMVYDNAQDYESLLDILFQNALQGFILIFLLLLLTLHPMVAFWATLGVVTAFAGSFIILPYADVSLNFMTVFGFLLVLGIMVDDAIIVGEAIYERVERGHAGADSAILATQMVLKPLMASVFVTMIAFLPWMFLTGEVQQFTRAISIVVMSTLIFSLIESLIILPAHLAHVRPVAIGKGFGGRLMALQQRCANSVIWFAEAVYQPLLKRAVRWRYVTLAVFVALFAIAIGLFSSGRVKQSFMPDVENDFMRVSVTMPAGTPFERTKQVAAHLDAARVAFESDTQDLVYRDPKTGEQLSRGAVRSWYMTTTDRQITGYIILTPPEARDVSTKEIARRLQARIGEIPDAEKVDVATSFDTDRAALDIALSSPDTDALRAAVEELKTELRTYASVFDVSDSEDSPTEELRISLRPGAEQLGLTLADVTMQARQAYFGEEVQRLPANGQDVRVYVRYPQPERRTLDSLRDFRLRTPDGREVPFYAVAEAAFAPGVTTIDRRDRKRSIVVSVEAGEGSAKEILKALDQDFWPGFESRHPTVSRRNIGEQQGEQEFFAEFARLVLVALAGMYMLLAVIFRAYSTPLLIMSVIPFAFVGGVIGHLLGGSTFALFSWLGLVAAAGVVVNDNVVLIDKANAIMSRQALTRLAALRGAGDAQPDAAGSEDFSSDELERMLADDEREAVLSFTNEETQDRIIEASVSRFRQIFLTSITEFVGTAPMMFERSVSAQFLKPMIIALAFGVLLCMPVTLLLTPALYMIAKDIKTWGARIWRGRAQPWTLERLRAGASQTAR
jgi:multidrug efflux pump subunit AcrB